MPQEDSLSKQRQDEQKNSNQRLNYCYWSRGRKQNCNWWGRNSVATREDRTRWKGIGSIKEKRKGPQRDQTDLQTLFWKLLEETIETHWDLYKRSCSRVGRQGEASKYWWMSHLGVARESSHSCIDCNFAKTSCVLLTSLQDNCFENSWEPHSCTLETWNLW